MDDFLLTARKELWQVVMDQLASLWKCGDPDRVSDGPVRFCGFVIEKTTDGAGYLLGQEPYLRDLLKRCEVTGKENVPLSQIEDAEDESDEDRKKTLRDAQSLVGKLGWLATRTRPDISYGVGLLSRLTHRRPGYVVRLCSHLLRYLNGSVQAKLTYRSIEHQNAEDWSHLPLPWSEGQVDVYVDTSYAPPHEKFRSVQGLALTHAGNLLAWESSRQSFVTQSTAESELVGYNEGFQVTENVCALLGEFGWSTKKVMYGDSNAARSQLTCETGSWRTRHLRVRAAKMREIIQDQSGEWQALHLSGLELIADGFTKALQGQAFERYCQKLHLFPSLKRVGASSSPQGVKGSGTDGSDRLKTTSVLKKLVGAWGIATGALIEAQQGALGSAMMMYALTVRALYKQRQKYPQVGGAKKLVNPSVNVLRVKVEVEQVPPASEQTPLRPGEAATSSSSARTTTGTPWRASLDAAGPLVQAVGS